MEVVGKPSKKLLQGYEWYFCLTDASYFVRIETNSRSSGYGGHVQCDKPWKALREKELMRQLLAYRQGTTLYERIQRLF